MRVVAHQGERASCATDVTNRSYPVHTQWALIFPPWANNGSDAYSRTNGSVEPHSLLIDTDMVSIADTPVAG
jgi:hypothetical protein